MSRIEIESNRATLKLPSRAEHHLCVHANDNGHLPNINGHMPPGGQTVHHYDAYCVAHHIPAFPLAISHADVCRHDLLFEIEIDAAVVGQ